MKTRVQESVHSVSESGGSQNDDEIEWRIIAVYRSTGWKKTSNSHLYIEMLQKTT